MTAVDIRATAREGPCDSAAATVVISAPVSAKNTVTAPARTVRTPLGDFRPISISPEIAARRLLASLSVLTIPMRYDAV